MSGERHHVLLGHKDCREVEHDSERDGEGQGRQRPLEHRQAEQRDAEAGDDSDEGCKHLSSSGAEVSQGGGDD